LKKVTNEILGDPLISVIVPVYNEEMTIGQVLEKLSLLQKKMSMEIVVVDDGSVDKTTEVVKAFPLIKIIRHTKNMGKGKAIATGLSKSHGQIVVIQDADGEYIPEEIPLIVSPIIEKRADVVFGSRFMPAMPNHGMSVSHKLGNVILSLTARLLYNTKVTDIMTGHKAFSREAINSIDLLANGFEVEVELTRKLLKRKWRLVEVPISYIRRQHGEAKITPLDGFICLTKLLFGRFR
jgi:glycosyltransferase involved in cell wall biosynthesis